MQNDEKQTGSLHHTMQIEQFRKISMSRIQKTSKFFPIFAKMHIYVIFSIYYAYSMQI